MTLTSARGREALCKQQPPVRTGNTRPRGGGRRAEVRTHSKAQRLVLNDLEWFRSRRQGAAAQGLGSCFTFCGVGKEGHSFANPSPLPSKRQVDVTTSPEHSPPGVEGGNNGPTQFPKLLRNPCRAPGYPDSSKGDSMTDLTLNLGR